jgi:ferrous iron transport protein B
MMGKWIEPVIAPLGYDWKIGIALISSFAAREVFVGTMATIYAIEGADSDEKLAEKMQNAVDPETNQKVFTMPTSLSLMVFYLFAMQCMSTLAVVKRETKSWKWPAIQLIYLTVLAYVASFVVYRIFL